MKLKNIMNENQKGIATVTFIVFVFIGLTITVAATTVLMLNAVGTSKVQQGMVAYDLAESGIESALLNYLRDPVNYTGEAITTPEGTITTSVNSTDSSITSIGTAGNFQKVVKVDIDYDYDLVINSWKEEY